ncbi:MAG: transposase domain-containing protein [Deltaproteobacteria bacterium]|nr:transposase domain-containing protein [Deltaproteobacteria bacterium]
MREEIDPDWVTEALQKTDTVTLRRRRLPAEEMIWLVIGMALLRDRPIIDVARTLDIGEGQRPADVSKSAVLQARARLGKEPLEWLFEQTAKTWAHRSADKDRWRGLALYGVDGSTVRVPDSESNANHSCVQSRAAENGAAARLAKVPPLRVSFITALRAIREEWYLDSLPGMSVGAIPRHVQRLNELLGRFVLPERRTDRSVAPPLRSRFPISVRPRTGEVARCHRCCARQGVPHIRRSRSALCHRAASADAQLRSLARSLASRSSAGRGAGGTDRAAVYVGGAAGASVAK